MSIPLKLHITKHAVERFHKRVAPLETKVWCLEFLCKNWREFWSIVETPNDPTQVRILYRIPPYPRFAVVCKRGRGPSSWLAITVELTQ